MDVSLTYGAVLGHLSTSSNTIEIEYDAKAESFIRDVARRRNIRLIANEPDDRDVEEYRAKMRQIVDSALPGVPLRHTPTPPPQLRVLPGYVYFELDRGVPDWREFATAPALGLHVAGDWPQLKMELWCVKRSSR